ncbi:MAG: hypothetical protein IJF39_02830 [Clostridia bacterium]|nr:hypothetical protein [Clostridia bacterium]
MSWLIYKHTNKLNGKCYIGQTKQTAKARWKNSNGYRNYSNHNSCVFFNAIKKYGWDNFEHTILEENIETLAKANEKEVYWINHYRSYIGFEDCNGYNMTLGGDTGNHLGYKVYQISKDLTIVAEFPSTAEASRQFGSHANDSQIRRCCEGLKPSCKGFYWCYVKNYTKDWKPKRNALLSPIFQIDDDLNIIKKYDSITECVKTTGFSLGSIVSCCQRKQRKANGFFWCYELNYNADWKPQDVKFNRNEKIYCFQTQTVYSSAKEANEKTGASRCHILRCCKGLETGSNGLNFCYFADKEIYECKETKKRPPVFSDEEIKLLKTLYPKLGICDELLKKFPGRTISTLRKHASQLGIKYIGENKNLKKVINLELNKIFNSIDEASKYVGLKNGSSIGQCCKGNRQQAAGFHWMFYDEYLTKGLT